jgi:uncharacterized membrane protein YbhN (UPF0104 family)
MSQNKEVSLKRKLYRLGLMIATTVAVVWFVIANVGRISEYDYTFRLSTLLIAFVVIVIGYLVGLGIWRMIARVFKMKASLWVDGRGYFLSYLGRYVPGKIGLALVRIEAYSHYPADRVLMATGLEMIVSQAAAITLVILGMLFSPEFFPLYLRLASPICFGLLVSLMRPPVLEKGARAFSRIIGRSITNPATTYRENLSFTGFLCFQVFLHGLGLFLILNSLYDISITHYFAVTGVYYAAMFIGFIAAFAPAGLGVREGVMFLVLPFIVSREIAIVATIAMRLATMLAELLMAGVFTIVSEWSKGRRV